MLALVGPLLVTAVLGQSRGGTIRNQVIDEQGKPVARTQVIYHEPALAEGKVKATIVRTETDAQGRFSLNYPTPRRTNNLGLSLWAYHPGLAITAERVILRHGSRPGLAQAAAADDPRRGSRRPADPGGKGDTPVPRLPAQGLGGAETLADRLAVTTGPDGQAILSYLEG